MESNKKMRICGGNLKGKKLIFSNNKITRPLKEIVKQSIFNTVINSNKFNIKLIDANILDLFSGTGSFGIECLSRGAKKVIFFENYHKSIKVLNENIKKLNLEKKSVIFEKNAYDFNELNLGIINCDLIFLDPPFNDKNIYKLIEKIKKSKLINKNTLLIIHRNKKIKESIPLKIKILREKNYGVSKIIFFKLN